ncbi:MAG: DinB family protein, partial [Bacteroidetes bacterium]
MDLQFAFEVNRQTRKNILRSVEGLTEKQINTIPEGFKNNIA